MQKFLVIICVCLLGGFACWNSVVSNPSTDELFLKNVEALADEEYVYPIHCDGDGDVACPKFGRNVKYVFQGLGLLPDEETY